MLGAITGVMWVTACAPPAAHGKHGAAQAKHGAVGAGVQSRHGRLSGPATGCLTSVDGVRYGPGLLLPTWLPPGFRMAADTQFGSTMPTENYTLASRRPDPPRIELGFSNYSGSLAGFPGIRITRGPASRGQASRGPVTIQGRRGRLAARRPRSVSAYWKPDKVDLISVTGYKLPVSAVVAVARNVWFDPPGLQLLPLSPGPVVSRRAAIGAARRATGQPASRSAAKLTSWAEIAALLEVAHSAGEVASVPGATVPGRWQPVWAVFLADGPVLVIVNAATGRPVVTIPVHGRPAWFGVLTDRSRVSARRCQGGSRSRLPFGVPTRDEEGYIVRAQPARPAASGGRASRSVLLKLTTVPAMNSADPGIYGGCVEQSCSINELAWVTITTVRADSGTTLACLPSSASVPRGSPPSQVHRYYGVAIFGNVGIYCGELPAPIRRLKDLAPPAG